MLKCFNRGGGKVERKLAAMAPEMAAYILE